jgi:thiamine pyrophosphate-dependent acetolactate synthase large subunit-like protein
VGGLGAPSWDITAAGDHPLTFPLWGAMGSAAMVGLGLALAQPGRGVLVITGDGEMLMGMGALATIGVQNPPNLAIIVFDNARYAETGMQPSHTEFGVSLTGVARSCGIEAVFDIADEAGLRELAERLRGFDRTVFARVAIRADEPPRVLPSRDGVFLKNRFRRAVGTV